ncbi:MAG: hypothetical protein HY308_10525 [Gammaproteobacteria bacterium]|nr:hypothetical protein [Gammaproteobacteria bacterium]
MSNQYEPPQAHLEDVTPAGSSITGPMIEALRGTKTWVSLIGILLLISAGFLVLGGIGMVLGSAVIGASGGQGAPPAVVFVGIGSMYVVFAAFYIFLGMYLVKYSSAISRLVSSGQAGDMEDALNYQRKFWKLAGVSALVMLVVMVLGIIAAIAVPVLMMAH